MEFEEKLWLEEESIFSYRHRKRIEEKRITELDKKVFKNLPILIHPLSKYRALWDWIISILVLYNSCYIPWHLAFQVSACNRLEDSDQIESQSCVTRWETVTNVIIDMTFWVDVILNFRSGYIDDKKIIYMNPVKISFHYMKSWFIVDFIANFPYDIIGSAMIEHNSVKGQLALKLYKIPQLLRTIRPFRNSEVFSTPNILRILKLMVCFLIASHWCGCIWYFIGQWQVEKIGANAYTGDVTWIEVPLSDDYEFGQEPPTYYNADVRTKYTASIYWALTTMSTVGYGDISPKTNMERFYTMAVQFLGAMCAAVILGNVAVLVANFDYSKTNYREKLSAMEEFFKSQKINPLLAKRSRDNFNYNWNMHHGMDIKDLLKDLPLNLQSEVMIHIQSNTVQNCYLFKNQDISVIRSVVTLLKSEMFLPNDIIYNCGDLSFGIFLIKSGKAKVLKNDGETVSTILKDGDIFGEDEMFNNQRRPHTIQALTALSVYSVDIGDLKRVLEEYPECLASLEKCLNTKKLNKKNTNTNPMIHQSSRDASNELLASYDKTNSNPLFIPLTIQDDDNNIEISTEENSDEKIASLNEEVGNIIRSLEDVLAFQKKTEEEIKLVHS